MFYEVDIADMSLPIFRLVGKNWMLITAGSLEKHNTMTASWGGFLVLWHENMATIFIRPQRYTKEFIDREKFFTLSFFEEKFKDKLTFCGRNSGRDVNKDKETKLTPFSFSSSVAYEEASLIFLCEKVFSKRIEEKDILDKAILDRCYEEKDFHEMYIARIVDAKAKKPNLLF